MSYKIIAFNLSITTEEIFFFKDSIKNSTVIVFRQNIHIMVTQGLHIKYEMLVLEV